PVGSSNPGSEPVGGTQFYAATPLNLTSALAVTLSYSVFFPASFDWVKGGKLPGLYGGRESCSGGDEASDCWSARFMWRPDGAGELYMYLPQVQQDPAICQLPPHTICNGDYGLSLGRGSFSFTRGAWTRLTQTIELGIGANVQDGKLTVYSNGRQVLHFDRVAFPAAHKGLFFSTFFGGHGDEWATPRPQAVYFKGFRVTITR
ncbi:polysaccharide lyase family 14 protein, partial [Ceraceosorus guamensis]